MTRNIMTPNELRVSSLLDNFLIGKRRIRKLNDKPDYINDLNNKKSIGIEIIDFYPILNNNKSIQSIEVPTFKLDEELKQNFDHLINKDYYVIFIVYSAKDFIKDKKTIEKILSSPNYNTLMNSSFILNGNEFIVKKSTNLISSYGGLCLYETLDKINPDINQTLVDWLDIYLVSKNQKLSGYEKTDLNGLAISDLHYSTIFDKNDNIETERRWKLALNTFCINNSITINFDYIYIITIDKVIQIK